MDQFKEDALLRGLNDHGFLFREKCEQVLGDPNSVWTVRASEYPVTYSAFGNKESTRIDLVLQAQSSEAFFAVIECKRANPEYVAWVFGSATYSKPANIPVLALERTKANSENPIQVVRRQETRPFSRGAWLARSWVEVKKDAKGTSRRSSTAQTIEDALRQALRGVEGLALEHQQQRSKIQSVFRSLFLPVVITTASLYVAEYRPNDIDDGMGTLPLDKVRFGAVGGPPQEVGWVMADYGAGEEIASEPIPANFHGIDPSDLVVYKSKPVFIVNSRHLLPFFSTE